MCTQDVDGEATARNVAFAFDSAGRTLPGWPVELLAGSASDPSRVVGDDLLILTHEFATADTLPQAGAWSLVDVARDGSVRSGVQYGVPDLADFLGRTPRLAPDGAAYILAIRGSAGAFTTEILALGVDGVRAGWPQTVDGILSNPTIGPGGRVYFTQVQGTSASTTSRTLVFESDGRSVETGSVGLPATGLDDRTGAGAVPAPPPIAVDGTAFIIGNSRGHTAAYAIDATGTRIAGWPYRLPAESQVQGSCGRIAGCGAWRTVPAIGSDDTLYLLLTAPGKNAGGSLLAVGIDGQVRPGWPVRLPVKGAGFWSVAVGSDGTVYAMAVEPSAGQYSWTHLPDRPERHSPIADADHLAVAP